MPARKKPAAKKAAAMPIGDISITGSQARKILIKEFLEPLTPGIKQKDVASVCLMDMALDTYGLMCVAEQPGATTIHKADLRMSCIALEDAVAMYNDVEKREVMQQKLEEIIDVLKGVKK
jgi:hypothetical protein